MHAVVALEGGATASGIALVARREEELAEVGTARPLHQVPGDGGHVAQLRRGAEEQRLRDDRRVLLHQRIGGDVAHAGQRSDADPARHRFDRGQRQRVDVDEVRRGLDARLHEVDEVRPAGDELRAITRARGDGVRGIGGAVEVKGMHSFLRSWLRWRPAHRKGEGPRKKGEGKTRIPSPSAPLRAGCREVCFFLRPSSFVLRPFYVAFFASRIAATMPV